MVELANPHREIKNKARLTKTSDRRLAPKITNKPKRSSGPNVEEGPHATVRKQSKKHKAEATEQRQADLSSRSQSHTPRQVAVSIRKRLTELSIPEEVGEGSPFKSTPRKTSRSPGKESPRRFILEQIKKDGHKMQKGYSYVN